MGNGVLVFATVACIVIATGFILAIAILRQSWAQKEREALTSSDLRALEESALFLIEQLNSEADRATEELESRCSRLAELLRAADQRIGELKDLETSLHERVRAHLASDPESVVRESGDPKIVRILDLASSGMESAEIAKVTGVDCAEVKLALRLAGVRN
jgi:hypothetical protein